MFIIFTVIKSLKTILIIFLLTVVLRIIIPSDSILGLLRTFLALPLIAFSFLLFIIQELTDLKIRNVIPEDFIVMPLIDMVVSLNSVELRDYYLANKLIYTFKCLLLLIASTILVS